jgi:hypothetical protein
MSNRAAYKKRFDREAAQAFHPERFDQPTSPMSRPRFECSGAVISAEQASMAKRRRRFATGRIGYA